MRKLFFLLAALLCCLCLAGAAGAAPLVPGKDEAITQQALMIENDIDLAKLTHNPAYQWQANHLAAVFMHRTPQQPIDQLIFIRALRELKPAGLAKYEAGYAKVLAKLRPEPGAYIRVNHKGLLVSNSKLDALQRVVYVWPAAQVDLSLLVKGPTRLVAALRHYYSQQTKGYAVSVHLNPHGKTVPLGNTFCDDDNWVGDAFLGQYLLHASHKDLSRAARVAWLENNRCWGPFGGNYWLLQRFYDHSPAAPRSLAELNHEVTAASTAGIEQLDLRLFLATHNLEYWEYARRADAWMRAYMETPKGTFYDRMTPTEKGLVYSTTAPDGTQYIPPIETGLIDPVTKLVAEVEGLL